jgi:hypothetical protein
VTPTTVSSLAQTLPVFPNSNSTPNQSSPVEKVVAPQAVVADAPKESATIQLDTVSLSAQSKLALSDIKKEELLNEAAKKGKNPKDNVITNVSSEQSGSVVSKVQFVYDLKGDIKVQYMDASDRLVYQVPTELMLRLKEAALKADSSVDTKV